MAEDLRPESLLESLKRGQLAPFYLFYGPEVFRLEKTLDKIRADFIPESARDLNLEIIYGDESDPGDIINRALSLPFLAAHRLIIVRRTENFDAEALDKFLPYLESPAESTCLIFVSSRTDFKRRFYKKIRSSGRTVQFAALKENRVVPWIKSTARDLDLNMDTQACVYLQQIVGNGLGDLYGELEKLRLRHGENRVGHEEVRELVINSRVFTIFELMKVFSSRNCPEALRTLNRFLEEEDSKGGPLRLIGMLNRQLRLLWQTRAVLEKGGSTKEVARKLGLPDFSAREFVQHSRHWSVKDLEKGLSRLYQADGWLKSGSRPKPILENLFVTLCNEGGL
jgi:DNA polymerase-3 subunit delta